jgi:hypothetical protein
MENLRQWLEAQFAEHRTEPNSGLGKAISYLLRHWTKLTLFLRQQGAPLDNNVVERALKKAILHRKNALFYQTMNGARVGDLFMGLIHTCELNKVNPFDYLTELLRHPAEVAVRPAEWMPWNYISLKPCASNQLKWPPNGLPEQQNRRGFSASHRRRRKCFGLGSMRGCPRTTSRRCPCKCVPCASTPPGAAGR